MDEKKKIDASIKAISHDEGVDIEIKGMKESTGYLIFKIMNIVAKNDPYLILAAIHTLIEQSDEKEFLIKNIKHIIEK